MRPSNRVNSPYGVVFNSVADAALVENVTPQTIRKRCRNNKNGWGYLPPEYKPKPRNPENPEITRMNAALNNWAPHNFKNLTGE